LGLTENIVLEIFCAFFSNHLFCDFGKIRMEEIGPGQKGHGAMCVEDCNSAHINHGSVHGNGSNYGLYSATIP
jgi:hypothetical protein